MGFTDLLFDRRCKVCDERISNGAVCPECDRKLSGLLQPRRRYVKTDDKEFEAVYLFDYNEPIVKKLLFALKRNADKELFLYTVKLYERLLHDVSDVSIVFAPRSGINKRNYGYDHMQRVSKLLCKRSEGRLRYICLIKRRHFTKEQKNLNSENRRKNVGHAFKITKNDIPKNIVLIDDVITSGNTVMSCAREILARRNDAVISFSFLASVNGFSNI